METQRASDEAQIERFDQPRGKDMATGVNGHERTSPNTLTARVPHRDRHPLPDQGDAVVLNYPNKLPEEEILDREQVGFCSISNTGDIEVCDSIDSNSLMLSDNYFGLHGLLESQVKPTLIYLDPPFCTGMDFQSRKQKHAYADKFGPAAYIEFMRRRLVLMRELLADDGSIYLHIGHQMIGHLKALMDEVFGPKNFRNLISRRKCSSKNFTSKQYANIHDYILFYSRSANYKWNQPGEEPKDAWIEKEYPKIDARGRYKLVPVHAPGTRRGETGKPWRGRMPPAGKHWQYQPSKLDELDANGEIHWSKNGNPRRKVYLPKDKKVSLTDHWLNYRDAHHQSIRVTGYPTEKNLQMLQMIVGASSSPGDLVLDPFCGSGTTLHAAALERRRWIGVDESFEAIASTLTRFRHGHERMGDYVSKPIADQIDQPMLFEDEASYEAPPNVEDGYEFQFMVDVELVDDHRDELVRLAQI